MGLKGVKKDGYFLDPKSIPSDEMFEDICEHSDDSEVWAIKQISL